jgi:hypothetical protein
VKDDATERTLLVPSADWLIAQQGGGLGQLDRQAVQEISRALSPAGGDRQG